LTAAAAAAAGCAWFGCLHQLQQTCGEELPRFCCNSCNRLAILLSFVAVGWAAGWRRAGLVKAQPGGMQAVGAGGHPVPEAVSDCSDGADLAASAAAAVYATAAIDPAAAAVLAIAIAIVAAAAVVVAAASAAAADAAYVAVAAISSTCGSNHITATAAYCVITVMAAHASCGRLCCCWLSARGQCCWLAGLQMRVLC